MSKVITERHRLSYRSTGKAKRSLNHARVDPDLLPFREAYRDRQRRSKELNENLAPLRRFLEKSVGRPWNDVKAEIHERISWRCAVQMHILQHLRDFVVEHVEIIDRIPYEKIASGGLRQPVASYLRAKTIYVCPHSGLLKEAPRIGRRP